MHNLNGINWGVKTKKPDPIKVGRDSTQGKPGMGDPIKDANDRLRMAMATPAPRRKAKKQKSYGKANY